MTKREVIELNEILNLVSNYGNTKFKYLILKNIEALKPHVTILLDLEKEIKKDLEALNKDRDLVITKFGTENEQGIVSIDTKNQEVMSKVLTEFKELAEIHKESIESYNKKMRDLESILSEDIDEELTLKEFSLDQLPEEGISIKQLEVLDKFKLLF